MRSVRERLATIGDEVAGPDGLADETHGAADLAVDFIVDLLDAGKLAGVPGPLVAVVGEGEPVDVGEHQLADRRVSRVDGLLISQSRGLRPSTPLYAVYGRP